jgi:hypothetical protein
MTPSTDTRVSAGFTPGPWRVGIWMGDANRKHVVDMGVPDGITTFAMLTERYGFGFPPSAIVHSDGDGCEIEANARLIAAAPDLALICWAMCVQDGRWEEWTPYDGSGEFIFAGLRYATRTDEFGCPKLTPALRAALTKARAASS